MFENLKFSGNNQHGDPLQHCTSFKILTRKSDYAPLNKTAAGKTIFIYNT